jgi:DNA-directed RNA polymerase I, II, and III subunit RPABC5
MTCGKVLANKWKKYTLMLKEKKLKKHDDEVSYENFDGHYKGKILDDLGINKLCCRRHVLTHVDLVDIL